MADDTVPNTQAEALKQARQEAYGHALDTALNELNELQPVAKAINDRVRHLRLLLNAAHKLTDVEIPEKYDYDYIQDQTDRGRNSGTRRSPYPQTPHAGASPVPGAPRPQDRR